MDDVVVLRPARSVEFEGEFKSMTDRLSLALYRALVLLQSVGPDMEPYYGRLIDIRDRLLVSMDTVDDHISCIEDEMDRIFAEVPNGEIVIFETCDLRDRAISMSWLTTHCHTIHVQRFRSRSFMSNSHDNENLAIAKPSLG